MDHAEHQRLLTALRSCEQRYQELQVKFQRHQQRLALVNDVRALLAREVQLPVIYKMVVESLASSFGYDFVSVYTLSHSTLILQHYVGYDHIDSRIPIEQGIIGRAARTRQAQLVPNVHRDADYVPTVPGIVGEMCVPLISQNVVVGAINVETRQPDSLNADDLDMLTTISDHIVIAITRARLYSVARESEERYRRLVEMSPEIIVVHSAGKIVYLNRAALDFIGAKTADQILGHNILEFVAPAFQALVIERQKSMRETGKLPLAEERFIRLDGTERDVEVVGVATTFAGQSAVQLVIRDVTERKHIEQERILYERKLLEAQKMESLGVLAGGIAHDFNNALMAILGNAALALLDLERDSESYQSVRLIEQAARDASELTKQMLAYSGRGNFMMQPLSLNELLHSMSTLLHTAVPKSVALNFDLADDLPETEADASQLRQIILNLLTNAGEAIGDRDGQILVKTYMQTFTEPVPSVPTAPQLAAGTYLCLEVRDSGIGIATETLDKMFDPFFTTKFTGRGLGLAVVLGIIRGHNGTIDVRSQPNRGTSIRVFLPPLEMYSNAHPKTMHTTSTSHHILVVDDEPSVRWVTERVLKRLGFEVLSASDGMAAVELLQQHSSQIACVLLDLTMPIMNGEQTLLALRGIRSDVPVIMMSGYSEEDASSHINSAGLVAFLQKPFTISELQEALSLVVQIPHNVS